jgi:tRNA pseudouridine13 synthase
MKLKQQPEDFRVEEIADPALEGGHFALYRLAKKSLGTPEAIGAICRAWRLAREAVSVGGLKDRHAATRQYLSIENGPRRKLSQTNFSLEYLGQTARPFDSKDILANRFEIVLRDLGPSAAEKIAAGLPQVAETGVPNYFDDQRFGSVGVSGDFIARPWCLGDYDRALWLALAEPNTHDRPAVREEKKALCAHWGDWAACRKDAFRPVVRAAMDRLCRQPGDCRGAFVRIPQHERRLYLEAFQSFLWNRILAESIRTLFNPADLFDVEIARTSVPFYPRRSFDRGPRTTQSAPAAPLGPRPVGIGPTERALRTGGRRVRPGVPHAPREIPPAIAFSPAAPGRRSSLRDRFHQSPRTTRSTPIDASCCYASSYRPAVYATVLVKRLVEAA